MMFIRRKIASSAPTSLGLVLPHAQRRALRLRTTLDNGEEVGLLLDRGTVLHDGDVLQADDGRLVRVVAAEEDLLEVASPDPRLLARAAYHLGNRHVPVEIAPGRVRFCRDAVLADMLQGLGLAVWPVRAAFEPEPGAYSPAGHSHGPAPARPGVIHDFAHRLQA